MLVFNLACAIASTDIYAFAVRMALEARPSSLSPLRTFASKPNHTEIILPSIVGVTTLNYKALGVYFAHGGRH